MKIKLIVAVLAILAVGGGYFGYSRYEQHKFLELITPPVKNASLRLANAVRYETAKETKITYKELFEKLESDVSEIEKRILDVQTVATPRNKDIVDPVVVYLQGGQELLRAILMKFRKELANSSARERANRAIADIKNASSLYGVELASKTVKQAIEDWKTAGNELKEASSDVLNASAKMREARANVATIISNDALTDAVIFEALVEKYNPQQPDITQVPNQTPKQVSEQGSLNEEAWVVALDAFSDANNVKQLRVKLTAAGLKSYTEPVKTSKGELTRVRAGPFASKETAEKARARLEAMGLRPGAVESR